nr:DUF551 domain-containing protein [Klebsiella quasipneumoniae]
MTKSTITRERLEELAAGQSGFNLRIATHEESQELARMALAAMDSEHHTDDELSNLLWYSQEATCNSDPNYYCEFQRLATPGLIAGIIRELQERRKADSEPVAWLLSGGGTKNVVCFDSGNAYADPLREVTPPYRHPQPAVVSEKIIDNFEEEFRRAFEVSAAVEQLIEIGYQGDKFSLSIRDAATLWKFGRAAMLSATPVCTCPSGDGSLRWPCQVHPGNSPVIPDGYVMVPKEMTDEIGEAISMQANCCGGIAPDIYDAMLAAAPQSPGSKPATVPGKWIPASERMPDENAEQQVLACFKGGDISALYYSDGRWDDAYGIVPIRQDVTHWMPLPAAPQEVKGE